MHFFSFSTLFTVSLLASNVAAHGIVTNIQGANGVNGVGVGVTDPTGKKLRLFNQAPRYLKGDNSACGSQKLDGKKQTPINFEKALAASIKAGLPTADAEGNVKMTLFQVNADGAGPYTCEVSADASGKNFQKIEVTQQIPGVKGKSSAKNKSFPFAVKLPNNLTCTGQNGACLIRCKSALNQPFGGCIAVAQSKSAGAGAGTGAGATGKAAAAATTGKSTKNNAVADAPAAVAVAKRTSPNRLEAASEVVARDIAEPAQAEDDDELEFNDEIEKREPSVASRFFKRHAMEEDLSKLFGIHRA